VPGYVTQLVHQLEREGHLRASDGEKLAHRLLGGCLAVFVVLLDLAGTPGPWQQGTDRLTHPQKFCRARSSAWSIQRMR
jgi:hypothetical protein